MLVGVGKIKRRYCYPILNLALGLNLLLVADVMAEDVAYGAYGLYPSGTTRVLAMGGAAVGLSDDAGAVLYNPASLSMSHWVVDFASTTNRVVNREVDFDGDNQLDGLPYSILFSSLALRLGSLGWGGGYSQPYSLEFSSDYFAPEVTKVLRIESRDMALSWRFGKSWALGLAIHQELVRLGYKDSLNALDLSSRAEGFYPSIGFRYQNGRKFGLGVRYSPERRYDMDEELDAQIVSYLGAPSSASEWFHNIVIPAKMTLGGSVRMTGRLIWVGDVDIYAPLRNAIYLGGSSLNWGDQIEERQKIVIHGGFEYAVVNEKNIGFLWRGGGYQEPPRLESSGNRLHYTMGVEIRLGILTFSAAYDQASDFSNIAQAVGLSLSAIK